MALDLEAIKAEAERARDLADNSGGAGPGYTHRLCDNIDALIADLEAAEADAARLADALRPAKWRAAHDAFAAHDARVREAKP